MDDEQSKILEKLRAISAQFKPPSTPEERAVETMEMLNYKPKNMFAPRPTEISDEETADIKARAAAIRAAREGKVYNPDLAALSGALNKRPAPESDFPVPSEQERMPAQDEPYSNMRKYLKKR